MPWDPLNAWPAGRRWLWAALAALICVLNGPQFIHSLRPRMDQWTDFFQLWGSALGGDGVSLEKVAVVDRNLPASPDYHVAPNAGHFSFLAPCSPEQARALPELCSDSPGFDRVAFHKEFDADVIAFFRKHLVETARP